MVFSHTCISGTAGLITSIYTWQLGHYLRSTLNIDSQKDTKCKVFSEVSHILHKLKRNVTGNKLVNPDLLFTYINIVIHAEMI